MQTRCTHTHLCLLWLRPRLSCRPLLARHCLACCSLGCPLHVLPCCQHPVYHQQHGPEVSIRHTLCTHTRTQQAGRGGGSKQHRAGQGNPRTSAKGQRMCRGDDDVLWLLHPQRVTASCKGRHNGQDYALQHSHLPRFAAGLQPGTGLDPGRCCCCCWWSSPAPCLVRPVLPHQQ